MEDLIYFEGKRNVSFDGEYFTVSKNEVSRKFDPKRYLNLFAEWYFIECDKRETVNEKLIQLNWAKRTITHISKRYNLALVSQELIEDIDLCIENFKREEVLIDLKTKDFEIKKPIINNNKKKSRLRKDLIEIDHFIKTEYTKYRESTLKIQKLSAFRNHLKTTSKHEYFQKKDNTIDSRIKEVLGNPFLK